MSLSPEVAELLRKSDETHEQVKAMLLAQNAAPSTVPIPQNLAQPGADLSGADQIVRSRLMAMDEWEAAREPLKTKSLRELNTIFARQAATPDTGVPLLEWVAAGGTPLSAQFGNMGKQLTPELAKALDSSSGSALIRQDLEPILYETFVRIFPMFDRLDRIPSNGLVHAWNQQTSFGDADWIGELDTVTDDRGTYQRQITNIGILATRRGVSLKSQFAVLQGGGGWNPERLELNAGLRAMASRYQKTILHGNWTDPAGTLNNEVGPYDEDSFDGLRKLTNTARAKNVDPATNPATTGSIRRAVDAATLEITENGGSPNAVFGSPYELTMFDEQQDDKIRIVRDTGGGITVGVRANSVETQNGAIPFYSVPGGHIGSYVATSTYSGNTVRDLYVLDESGLAIPYLGSPSPTVLEIPMGVNGQLNHLFIVFFMGGLMSAVSTWQNKIRVKVA